MIFHQILEVYMTCNEEAYLVFMKRYEMGVISMKNDL